MKETKSISAADENRVISSDEEGCPKGVYHGGEDSSFDGWRTGGCDDSGCDFEWEGEFFTVTLQLLRYLVAASTNF